MREKVAEGGGGVYRGAGAPGAEFSALFLIPIPIPIPYTRDALVLIPSIASGRPEPAVEGVVLADAAVRLRGTRYSAGVFFAEATMTHRHW